MRVGFIGFGNMAKSIVQGMNLKPHHYKLCACAKHYDKLCQAQESYHIKAYSTASEVIEHSDFIIVAVKPYQIEEVLTPVLDLLEEKVLISIAASFMFEAYETLTQGKIHHLSCIPNTPCSVGEGITIVEKKHTLTKAEYEAFEALFSTVSKVICLDEKEFSVGSTIAGCGPAFASMFIEALGDAGCKFGLTREVAYEIAAQMLQGTGALYNANKDHPGKMKDMVCSPSGSTIRGVIALEKKAFKGIVVEAIEAVEQG